MSMMQMLMMGGASAPTGLLYTFEMWGPGGGGGGSETTATQPINIVSRLPVRALRVISTELRQRSMVRDRPTS